MSRMLRRELRFLRAYVVLSGLAFVFLATAALRQAPAAKNLGEITVERINVVDANGTLRMVISNKDRMHPGAMDGQVFNRPRPLAGMIFFNDEGDEVGGLAFTGQRKDGKGSADAGLTFDQFKQDQIVGISYTESDGQRDAGLSIWDRADLPLLEVRRRAAEIRKLPTAEEQKAAAMKSGLYYNGAKRVFVGKDTDRSSVVRLADAHGQPRIVLKVDAAGAPSLEFLDETGKMVQRLPQGR